MSADRQQHATNPAATVTGDAAASSVAAAASLAEAWRQRVTHTAALAGVEADLAARSIPAILVLVLLAAALALTAWLTFVAGVAWFALQFGAPVLAVVVALSAVHAALAILTLRRAGRLSRNLTLPRLRASLTGTAATSST